MELDGDDVTNLVRNFYVTCNLPPRLNETQIGLIPKNLVCHVPSDFRPINHCTVVYKIITKSLANRLKPHLPNYIHPSQQAFIKGRCISNNIIVAQEIAHSFSLNSWDDNDFMLKINLAKTFDRIEWNFIVSALACKGLHSHFINLILASLVRHSPLLVTNLLHISKVAESYDKDVRCLHLFLSLW
jgi:hypothetical protein